MWKVRLGPREVLGHFEEADLRQKIQSGEIPWYAEAMRPGKRRYERVFKIPEFSGEAAQLKAEADAQQMAKQQQRKEKRQACETRLESVAPQVSEAEREDTEREPEVQDAVSEWKADTEAPTLQEQLDREDVEHAARMAAMRERHSARMAATQEQHVAKMASLGAPVAKPKDFLQQDVTWKTASIALVMLPLVFFGIWLQDSCSRSWDRSLAKSREEYEAPQKKLAEQMREEVQKEREKWEYQRQARETIRQGRLDELRKKSTAALAKEVTPLLRGDREKFCAAYPYLTVLLERDKDKSAESLVAMIRAKEKKEMREDQEGVTKKFCLCANGEVTSVREWGRGRGGCCGGGFYGPKIADVPHPRDRADCRGRDNAQLP